MKRRILSIAFVAISTILFTSVAQNESKSSQEKCKKECCKEHEMKIGKRSKAPQFNPFEGIELTEVQKEQLKTKTKACNAERKKMKQAKKERFEAERKNYKEMGRKHLDNIKQILTPEQYVKYLENIVINHPPKHKGPKSHCFHKKECANRDSMSRKDMK